MLSLWRRPCHSSGGMPLIRARACRMAVPWLNTATVWSGWAAAMRRRARSTRLPQFPQPLSTGGRPSGVAAVEAVQLPGWVRRTWPQVWSSQSPMFSSRSSGSVRSSRPLGS